MAGGGRGRMLGGPQPTRVPVAPRRTGASSVRMGAAGPLRTPGQFVHSGPVPQTSAAERTASTALWPPKANEFDSAAPQRRRCASLGT